MLRRHQHLHVIAVQTKETLEYNFDVGGVHLSAVASVDSTDGVTNRVN